MNGTPYLFAYGSLNPDLAPPEIASTVARFELFGAGFIVGALYDLGPYRGAVVGTASDRRIDGRLYRVPDEDALWAALDRYEGIDPMNESASLFVRRIVDVSVAGRTIRSWAYLFNGEVGGFRQINLTNL